MCFDLKPDGPFLAVCHTNSENRKKNQFNSKQIILILQTIIINNYSTHSYLVDIS